jgi:hypothetical protein
LKRSAHDDEYRDGLLTSNGAEELPSHGTRQSAAEHRRRRDISAPHRRRIQIAGVVDFLGRLRPLYSPAVASNRRSPDGGEKFHPHTQRSPTIALLSVQASAPRDFRGGLKLAWMKGGVRAWLLFSSRTRWRGPPTRRIRASTETPLQ